MSARNPFVTSFIYSADAIAAVQSALDDIVEITFTGFIGNENAGFFVGRLDTIGGPPILELSELIEKADRNLSEVDYTVNFDVAVVCDEPNDDIIIGRDYLRRIGIKGN